jgi:hypothetical protein
MAAVQAAITLIRMGKQYCWLALMSIPILLKKLISNLSWQLSNKKQKVWL